MASRSEPSHACLLGLALAMQLAPSCGGEADGAGLTSAESAESLESSESSESPESPARPVPLERPRSVLLISLDTLRADMLGAYGYARYPTSPFLDSFAAENILFENAIVQEPRTLTSHMSLLTGLYPHNHGVVDETRLGAEVPTLAELMKERGYRTQAFVDGGYLQARWGFEKGFDGYRDKRVGGEKIFERGRQWLQRNGDEPFFLFLHTYEIHCEGHWPYYASPPPFAGMFSEGLESPLRAETEEEFGERWTEHGESLDEDDYAYLKATYAEGIRHVDQLVSDFFDFLEERGLLEGLLVVIWSDHGEGLFDHGRWSHGELYDHTLRVPLLVRLPGWEGGPIRVRSTVSSIDIAPTILQLVGGPAPPPMDGTSLLGLLQEEEGERLAFSVRAKKDARLFSVRSSTAHFIWDDNDEAGYFFDLQADPFERENLFGQRGEAGGLRPRLNDWMEEWGSSLEGPERETQDLDDDTLRDLRALGYVE